MFRLISTSLLAAVLVAGASSASNLFSFRYNTAELNTSSAQRALLDRLEDEAREHCRDALRGSAVRLRQATCTRELVAEVTGEIDDPQLTAMLDTPADPRKKRFFARLFSRSS